MRFPALLGGLVLLACTSITAPRSDILTASASFGTVRLESLIGEPVFFMVMEREYSALALYALCTDPVTCPQVPPRATTTIQYSGIAGYEAGAEEALVLHWRLVPDAGGGFRADSVRALVTPLR